MMKLSAAVLVFASFFLGLVANASEAKNDRKSIRAGNFHIQKKGDDRQGIKTWVLNAAAKLDAEDISCEQVFDDIEKLLFSDDILFSFYAECGSNDDRATDFLLQMFVEARSTSEMEAFETYIKTRQGSMLWGNRLIFEKSIVVLASKKLEIGLRMPSDRRWLLKPTEFNYMTDVTWAAPNYGTLVLMNRDFSSDAWLNGEDPEQAKQLIEKHWGDYVASTLYDDAFANVDEMSVLITGDVVTESGVISAPVVEMMLVRDCFRSASKRCR